jgi:hypothetical protein
VTAPPGGFRLKLSPRAEEQRDWLKATNERRYKKVIKALRLLRGNPRHPSLNAQKYQELKGKAPDGGDMFEAYVENQTPSAWRIFFFYDSRDPGLIYVTSIEPHD